MPNPEVVTFEDLDLEGENNGKKTQTGLTEKLAAHLKLLRTKLSPEDFAAVTKELGFKTEMTNEELFEALKTLLAKKPEEEEEKPKEEEEKMASYKDFMTKCMKGGKDLKTCADDYKKQYPKAEPTKEEQTEMEQLAKKPEDEYPGPEYKKKMEDMDAELKAVNAKVTELQTKLTQEKNTAALTTQVDKLIEEKHLAPSQRDGVIKMAAGLPPAEQTQMMEFFRTTQKLGGLFEDKGKQRNQIPKSKELDDPKYRERLTKEFHIDDIVADRGVKPVKTGVNN